MKKQQNTIQSEISKKKHLQDHLNFFIKKLFSELKDEEDYVSADMKIQGLFVSTN